MPSELRYELGRRIRFLRRQRAWQQVDLAAHTETTRTHISDLELGRREICLHMLERVAAALDTTPADLLFSAQSTKK